VRPLYSGDVLKFVLVVALFAGAVYLCLWALERRRAGGTGGAPTKRPGRSPRPQTRQVAPDDDEDFLRWLERKRRKDSSADE
jgi:hypothetical protein